MKSKLIYAVALTIAMAVPIAPSYAIDMLDNSKMTHIDGNEQFPATRWQIVRYTFRLDVPKNSAPLSQLIIKVPETLTVSNDIKNITVKGENQQRIDTKISVQNRTIQLDFAKPIAPNTKFSIDLNNVRQSNLGNGPAFRFSAKMVGSNGEIPIGVSRFRIY